MEPCEVVDQWDGLTAQERLDELEALIDNYLVDLGYDPVTTEIAHPPRGVADYDYDNNHVRFDPDHLEGDDVIDVIDTAYHEMAHAMDHQDGDYDLLTDAEKEQFNDSHFREIEDGEWNFSENNFHADVGAFAGYMTDQVLKECQSEDPTAGDIYGSGGDLPLEMAMGEAVVEDAPPGGDAGVSDEDFGGFEGDAGVSSGDSDE